MITSIGFFDWFVNRTGILAQHTRLQDVSMSGDETVDGTEDCEEGRAQGSDCTVTAVVVAGLDASCHHGILVAKPAALRVHCLHYTSSDHHHLPGVH